MSLLFRGDSVLLAERQRQTYVCVLLGVTVCPSRSRQQGVWPKSPHHEHSDSPVHVSACTHGDFLCVNTSVSVFCMLSARNPTARLKFTHQTLKREPEILKLNKQKNKEVTANMIKKKNKTVCSCFLKYWLTQSFWRLTTFTWEDVETFIAGVNSATRVLKWFAREILPPQPVKFMASAPLSPFWSVEWVYPYLMMALMKLSPCACLFCFPHQTLEHFSKHKKNIKHIFCVKQWNNIKAENIMKYVFWGSYLNTQMWASLEKAHLSRLNVRNPFGSCLGCQLEFVGVFGSGERILKAADLMKMIYYQRPVSADT